MATRRAKAFLTAVDSIAGGLSNQMFADMYREAVRRKVEESDGALFDFLGSLEKTPVSIEEFIDGPEFLGATDFRLWPGVRKAAIEINSRWWQGGDAAYNEAVLKGATGCVDAETEYLTPRGWKRIADFVEGDQVAQYRNDGAVYFAEPRGYVRAECDQFLKFEARSVDQRLTLGHTFVYRSPKGKKLRSKTAIEVATQHNSTKNGFRGEILGAFGRLVSRECLPLDDTQLRVVVALIADGHFPGKTDTVVLRLKKDRKKSRLAQLLHEAGIEYTVKECAPYDGFELFRFKAPMHTKTYADLWGANQHQLSVIADEVLAWDGDTIYRNRFFTSLKEDADFIQFVFASTGRRASVCEFVRDAYSTEYTVNVEDKDFTTISAGVPDSKRPIHLVREGDGYCYCFRTDTGMWLSRRGGVIAVTGNTGKTSIAIVTMLYHVYLLHCLKNPQGLYGFPKATSIVFAIMGAKPRVVNKVIYLPMRKLVESMPHFQKHIRPDRLIESEMFFREKNIRIAQSGGDEDAILGEAIIGGIVDEINFMNVVLRSKKAEVSTGRAGLYDQAEQVFSTMQRRKRGRFTRPGPTIGIVIASSSTRYRNDFTDKRAAFIKKNGIKTAYVYSPKQYDVVPAERFSGKKFKLVIGNDVYHDTRVLLDDEAMPEGAWVEEVPIEYLDDFLNRPYDALRDVLGLSNNAISPFIKSRHKIYECVEAGNDIGLTSILLRDHVILGEHGMPQVKAGTYCMNPSRPRYVHIDLSRNADRCGVSMIRFDGMRQVKRQNGMNELLPIAVVELACTITPDANNEIDVAEVRAFVMHLKKKFGYPIKGVSYDGVDSRESIQAWRKDGMRATMISVDRFSAPYKQLRDAMYDTRVLLPDDELLMTEIIDLEFDETKDKIDHPVNGCFIGDTLIRMPNGGAISFEAAARSESIPVVTYDSGHVPSTGIRPRVTKNVTTLVCVTLATGAEIHCTPEHRFLLTSGDYKEAQHLTEIDDLQD